MNRHNIAEIGNLLSGHMKKILRKISVLIRNRRGKGYIENFVRLFDVFGRSMHNEHFDMQTNGETRVMRIISGFRPACIMDVGSNTGDWIEMASGMNPSCSFHGFEPVPYTFESCKRKLGNNANVRLNNLALSDKNEGFVLHLGPVSETATAFNMEGSYFKKGYYSRSVTCQAIKGSDYVRDNGISKIDFLKIDAEGMDFRVIRGFEEEIDKVGILQFEYGIFNIGSRDLLQDFYNHLEERGFVVGKIFPRYVKFSGYHTSMENFYGSVFIAVKKENETLIRLLSTYS